MCGWTRCKHVARDQRAKIPQSVLDESPGSVGLPLAIVAVHGSPVGEVVRQEPPGTSATTAVSDGVDDCAKRDLPGHAHGPPRRDAVMNCLPLQVGEVTWVVRHDTPHQEEKAGPRQARRRTKKYVAKWIGRLERPELAKGLDRRNPILTTAWLRFLFQSPPSYSRQNDWVTGTRTRSFSIQGDRCC